MYTAYINKEGNKIKTNIIEYTQSYQRDNYLAYCLVCDNVLNVIAPSTVGTRVHFRHKQNSDCPTVDSYKERYHNLNFRNYIPEQKERLLTEIKENLSCIYNECRKLCGNALFYSEFEELLKLSQGLKLGLIFGGGGCPTSTTSSKILGLQAIKTKKNNKEKKVPKRSSICYYW
mgnify:CR=1 FL=1